MERRRLTDDAIDADPLARDHSVARYLAGQMDEAEVAEFEAQYAQDPEVVRDIERTLRLKEGLAELKERGELELLLRSRAASRWYSRPAVGLAAAAAISALAVGVWL